MAPLSILGVPQEHNFWEELHVSLLLVPHVHMMQEDVHLAPLFVRQGLRPHQFKEELRVEESKEPHLEAQEVQQKEDQHRRHHHHLGELLPVLHILESCQSHHLRALLTVSPDAPLEVCRLHPLGEESLRLPQILLEDLFSKGISHLIDITLNMS